jgi:hypothetical protein
VHGTDGSERCDEVTLNGMSKDFSLGSLLIFLGRVMSIRLAGSKLVFIDVHQDGQRVQGLCNLRNLAESGTSLEAFKQFRRTLQRGDILSGFCPCSCFGWHVDPFRPQRCPTPHLDRRTIGSCNTSPRNTGSMPEESPRATSRPRDQNSAPPCRLLGQSARSRLASPTG